MFCVAIRTIQKKKQFQGQSESKKAAKKLGPETKGTAMSFGFKKKIYSTNKKNGNSTKEKDKLSQEEQFGSIKTDNGGGDDNGNQGTVFYVVNLCSFEICFSILNEKLSKKKFVNFFVNRWI